jgi:hypothetical protein
MSQSTTFSDLVDGVVNGIIEALTNRPSMTQARRDAQAWMVREMARGLCPVDVRQLMVASQSVLLHVLTIDAAGDEPLDSAATPRLRALSTVANLNRTMTKNLDVLGRLQAQTARALPAADERPLESGVLSPAEPTANRAPEAFQRAIDGALSAIAPPSAAAPSPPLNRQQKRQAEREYARLARRMLIGKSVDRINAQ